MSFFDNFDVRQIENIELLAQQVVEGFIIGLHKSPFHGFSVEFAEHRLYNPGESTKDIDWKVYARSDKMFTKKFEEETNLRCQIIIDTSSSMYFPESDNGKGINKLQFSALAGASIMNLLKKQRDAFGLSVFDNDVRIHTKCRSATSHYRLLLSYLDGLIKDTQIQKTTSTAKALHQLADSIHRRSLVIIFSDMFDSGDDTDDLFAALQHLKYAKHEVLLFHVTDRKHELAFEYENRPYLFVDMESGEEIKLQHNQVKDLYVEKVMQYKNELKMKCLQYKIEFIEADIQDGFVPVLQNYMVKRNRLK
ncbi:MAG TPA: DUF58 domain-containing protein [Saprospiraceae bacterium]|jgi:uncharacterized protein (DUF58 family)|nr:DUF58 domain-containing protein [Saprospiraceae bacterium]MBK8888493.1 DUF58 domain-containing protein [Saprospiraceae bacterium]MBK9580774.1 DUF58 domain-containing protein [Saprospiraceae bacterium]HMT52636.1 DUF58 domain-containing protein [Saprospiraceae bacterium]HMT71353.1 DUF58 domain-containing protein [Saprospiraceae bacterium]